MKKIAWLLALLPLLSLAKDVDVESIIKKIEELKNENRVSSQLDYKVYDPFLGAKSILKDKNLSAPQKQKKSEIVLQTILNNRVLIGGKWYSAGDIVQGGVIESINSDHIVVTRNKKKTKVYLKKTKNILNLNKE